FASKNGYPSYVIFDLDYGLLLDTESIYTECMQSILDRYGKVYTRESKIKAMGRPRLEAAQVVVDDAGIPLTAEEFSKELYSLLFERFPTARYMYMPVYQNNYHFKGAFQILQHLSTQKVPLALATSSHTAAFESKMSQKPELLSCFSHTVCGDNPEVKNGKPSPDIFLVAASKFDPPPLSMDKVLVFEDAPNGVVGAKAAGMNVVMVPDKMIDPELTKEADVVLESLTSIRLEDWGLPAISFD
ncbi:PREDICTED: LOW QUALITY PROTEIN: pseudouridine-5'-phosphatase-like, partial [Amphimedon queenslandica]|uniref:pseudouridine 5'-phosphatase n=1 Tax=Amphimedon queenslandica TaxID=400682 RepID=A0AAN0JDH5_AMPQE